GNRRAHGPAVVRGAQPPLRSGVPRSRRVVRAVPVLLRRGRLVAEAQQRNRRLRRGDEAACLLSLYRKMHTLRPLPKGFSGSIHSFCSRMASTEVRYSWASFHKVSSSVVITKVKVGRSSSS